MNDPTVEFAQNLFRLHPEFVPTQALYLDLEGRQNGSEDILSLYWPALSGPDRFSWIHRTISSDINRAETEKRLREIGADTVRWLVVYSAGQSLPEERTRMEDLFGADIFPDGAWINMLHVVQTCPAIKRSIRDHRYVWYGRDQIRVRYSLEALEWEFGIKRSPLIRSHGNRYLDLGGSPGDMKVLSAASKFIRGLSTESESACLRDYCQADVGNMFHITYASERLLFNRAERRNRRRTAN